MKRVFLIGMAAVIALYFFAGAASALPIPIRSIAAPIASFSDSGDVREALLGWNNLSGIGNTENAFREKAGYAAIGRARYWYADHERDLGFLDKQKLVPLNWRGREIDASSAGVFDRSSQAIFPFAQKDYSTGMAWFANSIANPANVGAMVATLAVDNDSIGHASVIAWEDLAVTMDWSYSDDILGLSGERSDSLVPEPATMLLFGICLLGLAALGRKKLFKE